MLYAIYPDVTVGNALLRRVGGSAVLEYNKESASSTDLIDGWPPSCLYLSLIEIVWSLWGLHQTYTYDKY
jgi:hypothetical protein